MNDAKKSLQVARIIFERIEGFDPLKGSMTDCIVAGSYRRNRDGSITIRCQVSVDDGETGERWVIEDKKLRLPKKRHKQDKPSKANA